MGSVVWNESPNLWTAMQGDVAVCSLKSKDIGGWTASWLNGQLWAPPAHMPKAKPQETRFFTAFEEAKLAVEQQLQQS